MAKEQLTVEKEQLEADLQRHSLNAGDERDAVKQENECLQRTLQSLTENYEAVQSAFERATRQSEDETRERIGTFEREQTELQQRLSGLQGELALFKEHYDSLMTQVNR